MHTLDLPRLVVFRDVKRQNPASRQSEFTRLAVIGRVRERETTELGKSRECGCGRAGADAEGDGIR
ncbi:MAG: hypothetical protein WBP48_14710 [Microbacterium sp.]